MLVLFQGFSLKLLPWVEPSLILENAGLRVELQKRIQQTRPEDGYGLLICKEPGERHLADFDVANIVSSYY